jgi:2-dehydro-3-deoxyphosphogluconate aldolase/(4S)-4-hydroxy-2-oxoglutarate aldolase
MAKFDRLKILSQMIGVGVIPVFYTDDIDAGCNIIKACLEGGAKCIEFTNRGDRAHIIFQAFSQEFAYRDDLILGAGSIIDPGTASLYIQLGAEFIVGPVFVSEIAKVCNRRKIPYCPGCGTASEISRAEEYGSEIVKVFPGAQTGGPDFVRAIKGPMPRTKIMPTGGVKAEKDDILAWFKAGASCVGMGSQLITKAAVDSKDYSKITHTVRNVIGWIQEARSEHSH